MDAKSQTNFSYLISYNNSNIAKEIQVITLRPTKKQFFLLDWEHSSSNVQLLKINSIRLYMIKQRKKTRAAKNETVYECLTDDFITARITHLCEQIKEKNKRGQ